MDTLPLRKIGLLYILAISVLCLMLFGPAGSLRYWQAWIYIAVMINASILIVLYFRKHDPGLLERRMRYKEKEIAQKRIIGISALLFVSGFIMPGLDYRFGWSAVPLGMVIVAEMLIILSYALIFAVFRVNSYTSRTVEVLAGQKLISSGPYALVRHPMYVGVIVMYLATPIALASYWAMIFFLPIIPLIVWRTLDEERVLRQGLPGYAAYCKRVRYRFIPKVW